MKNEDYLKNTVFHPGQRWGNENERETL